MGEIDERATRVPLTEFAKICSLRLNRFTITATGYICSIFFFFFDLVNHARSSFSILFFLESINPRILGFHGCLILFFTSVQFSFTRVSIIFLSDKSNSNVYATLYDRDASKFLHGARCTVHGEHASAPFFSLSPFFFFPFTRHVIISRMRIPLPRE